MDGLQIFTQLRNLLADLYTEDASARRVAVDAGLTLRHIAFSPVATNNWQAILIQAIKTQRLDALLDIVRQEYSDNPTLRQVDAAYRDFLRAASQPSLLTPAQQSDLENEISPGSALPTPQPLSFFLGALLVEGIMAIGAYDLYLYTAQIKAPGLPFLWLSLLIPLLVGLGLGLRANITSHSQRYLWTALATGLLNSSGVVISLTYYLRGGLPVIDWSKVFYLYFLAPIFCIAVGGIIGSWVQQHIQVKPARI